MVAGITLIIVCLPVGFFYIQTTRTEQKRKGKQSLALRVENDGLKSLSRCTNTLYSSVASRITYN